MAGLGRRLLGATLVGAGAGIVERARQQREDTLIALRRKHQVDDRNFSADLTREGWDRSDARADAAADLTREGWDRSDARADAAADLTREGWDRADARAGRTADRADARTGRDLVPVLNDAGETVYMPRSEAKGRRVPGKRAASEPLVKVRGEDGKPLYVPRGQAAGREPWERPRQDKGTKLTVLEEDPVTGKRTYGVYDAQKGGIVPVGVVDAQGGIVEDATAQPGESGPSWFERAWSAMFGGDEEGGDGDMPPNAPPSARRAPDGKIYVPVEGGWREWRP